MHYNALWFTEGGSSEEWVKITRAHEVLSDDQKRRTYDQHGEEGLKRLEGGGGGGGGDPFGSFFDFFGGGGSRQQQGGMAQGVSLEFPLVVTLKDLYLGKEFHAAHRKKKLCSHCRGLGADDPSHVKQCPSCGGRGFVLKTQRLAPGFVTQTQMHCDACGGKGKIVSSTCHVCHGAKTEVGEDVLSIYVEKGMRAGAKITFKGKGDEQPDEHPGDISFVIVEAPDEKFRRDGDDLHVDLVVSLEEALVGFTRQIAHLDGHPVTISRQDVTRPGQVLQIQEEGMPVPENASEKGDLFVTVKVVFPTLLQPQQREQVKSLMNGWTWAEPIVK